jgi:GWxTD domain-containing protein
MEMKATDAGPFALRITAHDLNRDTQSTLLLTVGADTTDGRQKFLPLGPNGLPLFNDRFPPHTHVTVRTARHAGALLHAAHFPPVTKLPAPVFADVAPPALNAPPDSIFTIHVQADGTFGLTTGSDGFYYFRADTARDKGYTLFVTTQDFPLVTAPADMVAPLRYISSLKEWDAFSKAADPRKAVERFWTDAAGDRDRAREAIAAYYGRVESANRHVTSYVEGWKTDRGLVHIIFGTPNTIRKNIQGETWIYGDETNLMSLTFSFVKREEPFSDNDLVFRRDPQLKSAWYRNVESWRNGRVLQN